MSVKVTVWVAVLAGTESTLPKATVSELSCTGPLKSKLTVADPSPMFALNELVSVTPAALST